MTFILDGSSLLEIVKYIDLRVPGLTRFQWGEFYPIREANGRVWVLI